MAHHARVSWKKAGSVDAFAGKQSECLAGFTYRYAQTPKDRQADGLWPAAMRLDYQCDGLVKGHYVIVAPVPVRTDPALSIQVRIGGLKDR